MKKTILLLMGLVPIANAIDYKWGYISAGSYFDMFQGSHPFEWKARGEEGTPPLEPAPQVLSNLKGAVFFGLSNELTLALETDVFYNTVGPYDTYYQDANRTFNESTVGLGDSKIRFIYELKSLNLFWGIQTIIPGVYDRPGLIQKNGTKVLPWTGLGAFRLGTEFLYKKEDHSVYGEYIHALPSQERASINQKSLEFSLGYDYKKSFAKDYNFGLGLYGNYKDFTWLRPEKANRKDFALYPKFSIGWYPIPSNEVSLSFGFSAYSWVDDSVVKEAPGSFFISIYSGFY
jgi:hypothetical protein